MSSTGSSITSAAGDPKSPNTAGTYLFSALEANDPTSSNYPSETSRAPSHPPEESDTPSLPNPGKLEGKVTPGDEDIPDSIATALLDDQKFPMCIGSFTSRKGHKIIVARLIAHVTCCALLVAISLGESTWDHPCDDYYRKLYEEEKKKKLTKDKAKHDKSKQQAKRDVNQLLGRNKKKRSSSRSQGRNTSNQLPPKHTSTPTSSIFHRKPLPGIGQQGLDRGDTPTYLPLASDQRKPYASDKPHSYAQTNSLASHPYFVESKDDGPISDDDYEISFGDDCVKHSANMGQPRSGQDAEAREEIVAASRVKPENMKAPKEAKDAIYALMETKEKSAGLELVKGSQPLGKIVKGRKEAGTDGEEAEQAEEKRFAMRLELGRTQGRLATMRNTIEEHEEESVKRRHESNKLRAEVARYLEEARASKRRETVARNEINSARKALSESQLQIAQLKGALASAEQEKARSAATADKLRMEEDRKGQETAIRKELNSMQAALDERRVQIEELKDALVTSEQEKAQSAATADKLRLEAARLREDLQHVRIKAERHDHGHDADVETLRTLATRVAEITRARDGLSKEVGDLKQQLLASEDALRREKTNFEAEQTCQKDSYLIESLRAKVNILESEIEASKRKNDFMELDSKINSCIPREDKATMAQEELQEEVEDRRLTVDVATMTPMGDEERSGTIHIGDDKMVTATDLERAIATAEAFRETCESSQDKKSLTCRLQLAEEQISGLQSCLQGTRRKLAAAEAVAVCTKEESSEAARIEGNAAKKLIEAESRCAQAEERLVQTCADRATLEISLREMTNTNAAQAMELREARNQLMVFNGKECQNTHSQTEDRKRSCDLDRRLVQSMEDLECAKATKDAQRNKNIASARQEENKILSKREQEELIIAEAQKVQDDTKKKKNMLVAESRCSHTEEQLGQACADRATLESSLREMADAKSAQERELRQVRNQLRPFLEKRGRDAYSQTEPEKRSCDLDRKLLKLEEDLERARASIVSSERNVFEKEQQLVESTARASKAMDDAQRNQKLAFSRQEKIDSLSKREQDILGDLDQAHVSLQNAEVEKRRADAAAKESKRRLLDAKKDWHQETHELRVSLQDALKGVRDRDRDKNSDVQKEGVSKSSKKNQATSANISSKSGGESSIYRDLHQSSTSGTSDATNQGLADELMHKLAVETNRRRSARHAFNDKTSRSWTKKLEDEKRVLALAKQVVKHHKQRVRRRQHNILRCQARWRDQRQHSCPHHPGRHRPLEEAKRELNREVFELNGFVKQLRHNKSWLDRRERKIFDFQELVRKKGPWSGDRQKQHASNVASTHRSWSSGSSGGTPEKRTLEALQQELEDGLSDFSVGSSHKGMYRSRETMRHKVSRPNQSAASRGKENTSPASPSRLHVGYKPFCPVLVASDHLGHEERPFVGKLYQAREGYSTSRSRNQQKKWRHQAQDCLEGFYGSRDPTDNLNMHDLPTSSEVEFQNWLSRPEGPRRNNFVIRERTEHIAKLTVEGRKAQSAVALHVEWLNTLRREIGLLGSDATESSRPRVQTAFVADISPSVDALLSPRRVVRASES